eukprot:symbB.v1.2.035432.t1/scaffold4748.1/size59687/7
MTQVSNSGKNAAVPMPDLSAVRSNVHFTGGQKVSLGMRVGANAPSSQACERVLDVDEKLLQGGGPGF